MWYVAAKAIHAELVGNFFSEAGREALMVLFSIDNKYAVHAEMYN